jgi:hypothetical protein
MNCCHAIQIQRPSSSLLLIHGHLAKLDFPIPRLPNVSPMWINGEMVASNVDPIFAEILLNVDNGAIFLELF